MKKILALVLVMAVSAMAVTFTGSYDAQTQTVTISYDAAIVGLALDVTSPDVAVTDVTLPDFFDVFMDYAYDQGESYVYGAGTPIANIDAAGSATLTAAPTAFCISAGGLEDDAADTVPALGDIVLAVTGTGDVTIDLNTLRGGVVDYNGAITEINGLPLVIAVAGEAPICRGDLVNSSFQPTPDGVIDLNDMNYLMGMLGMAGSPYSITADASNEAADLVNSSFQPTPDGVIDLNDMNYLMGMLGMAGSPYSIPCN